MTDKQILSYIKNELSEDERHQFLDWVSADPTNKEYYRLVRKAWDLVTLTSDSSAPADEEAYSRVKAKLAEFTNPVSETAPKQWWTRIREPLKIAAAILITAATSWYVFQYRDSTFPIGYHHIEVASGQRVKLQLADSSTVWLAAGTRFSYPEQFSAGHRQVKLNGEAQFHVKHNSKSAFVVETDIYNIEVLGTKFNVYAYDENSRFETTLYEGAVSLWKAHAEENGIRLRPGQQAVYSRASDQLTIFGGIDTTAMDDWIAGYIIFDKTPFRDMAERLSRYYQKPITIKNPAVADYECTGKFRYQEKLEKILKVVSISNPFKYQINEDEVIIY